MHGQYFNIFKLEEAKEYSFDKIYCTSCDQGQINNYYGVLCADPLIAASDTFARMFSGYKIYYQQFPSGGLVCILVGYMLGFKKIYIAGFDLYSNPRSIYPWNTETPEFERRHPRDTRENTMNVINLYHPRDVQLRFIECLQNLPGLELLSVSKSSPINKYVDLASETESAPFYKIEKPQDAINDWVPLPEINSNNEGVKSNIGNENTCLVKTNFFNYQRIRFLKHITFGRVKKHYTDKYKRYTYN